MKLRTSLRDSRLVVDDAFIDHQNIEWYQAEHVSHDALAAHALLQAMEEFDREGWSDSANPIEWARERADELMREWTTSEPSSNPR